MDDLTKLVPDMGGEITADGAADPAAALSGLQNAVQGEGGIDGLMTSSGRAASASRSTRGCRPDRTRRSQPAQLEQALGPDTVQRLSAGSGLNVGQLLPLLAAFLPQIINMLTPKGNVPSGGLNRAACPTSAACWAG